MDCREVQKKLSAFVGGVITAGERKQITTHLKKCKGCKRDLADLRKTVRYIKRLEEVEPPVWFVQRVMARVRDEAERKRGVWRRFFLPLHIKVPLEAIALICIVVGAVYIFKSMEPTIKLAQVPKETRGITPPSAPHAEKPRVVGKGQPTAVYEGERSKFEKKYRLEEDRSVKIAQAPTAPAERKEAAPATGYADYATVKRDVASSLQGEQLKTSTETKAKRVSLVVRVRDLAAARRRVEEIARQMGGTTSTTAPVKDQAVIAIALDGGKVPDFLVQLQLVGEVQDKGWTWEQREGNVTLTVEVKKISGNQPD